MAIDVIPKGGGFADGIKFFTTPAALPAGWQTAMTWCNETIQVVRGAAEPNPWKSASEEEIAGELLRQIEARKAVQRASK